MRARRGAGCGPAGGRWRELLVAVVLMALVCTFTYAFASDPETSDNGRAAKAAAGEWRHVIRVIDGDTIILDGGEKVRLIGVDTPETVHF